MRYIGVLHDVKATEKSIAAGGRDSVKDEETGVSGEINPIGRRRLVPQSLAADDMSRNSHTSHKLLQIVECIYCSFSGDMRAHF